MTDDLDRYWYVAAVFREPRDLAATIGELRSSSFAAGQLLVLANHRAEDARRALDGNGETEVQVLPVQADGRIKISGERELPVGIKAILKAMDVPEPARDRGDGASSSGEEQQAQVYVQLRRDIADGALVLIASVADPEDQLHGARVLLRGNCECVLTHEMAAPSA